MLLVKMYSGFKWLFECGKRRLCFLILGSKHQSVGKQFCVADAANPNEPAASLSLPRALQSFYTEPEMDSAKPGGEQLYFLLPYRIIGLHITKNEEKRARTGKSTFSTPSLRQTTAIPCNISLCRIQTKHPLQW